MLKKLILATAVVIGLIYGSGGDIASLKRAIAGAASENGRAYAGEDSGGWG